MSLVLAHGIGAVKDLPVPLWLFYYGAGAALIVSFVALGALWRRPVLERLAAQAQPLAPSLQRILLGPELRLLLGAASVFLLGLVFATGLVGEYSTATNLAPTFVYVVFWVGLVPVVVLLGDVWRVLSPWKAAADGAVWVAERAGLHASPTATYPERLGRWPAAVLLLAWASLELAYPNSASPRALALGIAVYSWVTWLGMAVYGREAWLRGGEAFAVYFGLLARLAPFAVRQVEPGRRVVVRTPPSGLAGPARMPGTLAFLAVMLGSVGFDGFSRSTFWQDRLFSIESALLSDSPAVVDLVVTLANFAAMLGCIVAVAAIYLLAVAGARSVAHRRESLAQEFVLSLVPIALAYVVAHYFSLLVLQGQAVWRLVSDPFGWGWDLFGTAGFEPNLTLLSPNTVWYVQVAALVAGHVLGLALAHDRAVALFRSPRTALRTQYAMLVLMVAYTVGGLWLLSNG